MPLFMRPPLCGAEHQAETGSQMRILWEVVAEPAEGFISEPRAVGTMTVRIYELERLPSYVVDPES